MVAVSILEVKERTEAGGWISHLFVGLSSHLCACFWTVYKLP